MKMLGEYIAAAMLIVLMIPVFLIAMLIELFAIKRYLKIKSM
jgi:hypothetical protein